MDTDILISDYSSTYIDYLLLDRPLIFYNFDYEDYLQNDREMYYDYDEVTPGYKAATFDELMKELDSIAKDEDHFVEDRQRVRDLFYCKEGQQMVGEKLLEFLKNLK